MSLNSTIKSSTVFEIHFKLYSFVAQNEALLEESTIRYAWAAQGGGEKIAQGFRRFEWKYQ